jgi:hypothetical protein
VLTDGWTRNKVKLDLIDPYLRGLAHFKSGRVLLNPTLITTRTTSKHAACAGLRPDQRLSEFPNQHDEIFKSKQIWLSVPETDRSLVSTVISERSKALFLVLESRVMGDYLARFVGGLVPSAADPKA